MEAQEIAVSVHAQWKSSEMLQNRHNFKFFSVKSTLIKMVMITSAVEIPSFLSLRNDTRSLKQYIHKYTNTIYKEMQQSIK